MPTPVPICNLLYIALQEDHQYVALPLGELQPDGRFSDDACHKQEESSNCKTMG